MLWYKVIFLKKTVQYVRVCQGQGHGFQIIFVKLLLRIET